MLFVPYSCDAPIYHLPLATGGLILANVLVFAGVVGGQIDPTTSMLVYGDGIHPEQWVLSLFMHANLMHLLGNMFFLWVFGLVVEGKLGWRRFLACYLLIGVGQSALEQTMLCNTTSMGSGSLGASAAIYGLMAMACVWAPMNEVKMFGWVIVYGGTFDVTIGVLSAIYVGMELTWCLIFGHLALGTSFDGVLFARYALGSMLHLSGAVIGGVLGIAMLKWNTVDCERWDLFSVMHGTEGQPAAAELVGPTEEQRNTRMMQRALEAKRKVLAFLEINQPEQALVLLQKCVDLNLPLNLNREETLKLILKLHENRMWKKSAPLMARFLKQFPEQSAAVRLRLAQICLVELERPAKTLELLESIDAPSLNAKQADLLKKLRVVAQRLIDEGAVELDDVI